jgi:hypothetical protein
MMDSEPSDALDYSSDRFTSSLGGVGKKFIYFL